MMGTTRRQKAFSYVLVSAVPIEGQYAAGIGVIFKDENRRTVTKISQALGEATVEQATYEALTLVLEEAMRLGVRSFTVYVDSPAVVAQVTVRSPKQAVTPAACLRSRSRRTWHLSDRTGCV